jgi:hypothetical protein
VQVNEKVAKMKIEQEQKLLREAEMLKNKRLMKKGDSYRQ